MMHMRGMGNLISKSGGDEPEMSDNPREEARESAPQFGKRKRPGITPAAKKRSVKSMAVTKTPKFDNAGPGSRAGEDSRSFSPAPKRAFKGFPQKR